MADTPRMLFVVRVRPETYESVGWPADSEKPLGMEGVFAGRERAEAFQADLERRATQSGTPGPLLAVRSLARLRQLSAFDPGVLRDWLIDHDIPCPDAFARVKLARDDERFLEWYRDATARHWTFVGRSPREHDAGRWLEWLREGQEEDGYLDWLLSLSRQQRAGLYAALHHFRFYEIVEVPYVVGEYPEEEWEAWEAEARRKPYSPCLIRAQEERPGSPATGPVALPHQGRKSAATSVTSRKAHVIVCQVFASDGNVTPYSDDTPLKAFGDRAQAEAYLDRCWRNLDDDYVNFELVDMDVSV